MAKLPIDYTLVTSKDGTILTIKL